MSVRTADTAAPSPSAVVVRQCVTYGPTGMPDVMVLVDEAGREVWCPGRVHLQQQVERAGWVFTVDYVLAGQSRTGQFPARRVRGDAVSRFLARR